MIGAFLYLIRTTTRNRIVSQLKRVKSPRYAIALLFGIGYFWLMFFNGSRNGRAMNDMPPMFLNTFGALLPIGLLIAAVYTWLFGGDRSALAFTQAEVAMLFTAPVSRRGLIIYKLARSQTAVLTTSFIWLILFRHGSGAQRMISFWLLLSIISLHRLGATLFRAAQVEKGKRKWKERPRARLVLAVVAGIIVALATSHFDFQSGPLDADTLRTFLATLHAAPWSWILYPFSMPLAPLFAHTDREWAIATVEALGLLVLHFLWVLHSDAAFEESAAEASAVLAQRVAAVRSRSIVQATQISEKNRRRTIPLSSMGAPLVAIVWKNYLWLLRSGMLRTGIGLPLLLCAVSIVFGAKFRLVAIMTLVISGSIGMVTFVFGPMGLRNDLRSELARASTLKTFPLDGHEILFAEVASSGSAMALMQFLYLASALIAAASLGQHALGPGMSLAIVAGALFLLPGLNFANFSVYNGLALMFPAWVRTGDSGVSGIETMGQTMLTLLVTLLLLVLLCLGPAVAGAAVYFLLRGVPAAAIAATGIVAGALLVFETWISANVFGGMLDRLEPMHVG